MNAEPASANNSACPRCGTAFHCSVNDALPCACGTVRLPDATLQSLREQFTCCLCPNCLRQLQAIRVDS